MEGPDWISRKIAILLKFKFASGRTDCLENPNVENNKNMATYVNDWIYEDVYDKISSSQFGGLPGTSTIHALIYLLHKWNMAMESPQKIVRITFLDFRKAFDLINHNVLLENFMQIGVRPAVVGWFSSYLYNRS